MAPRRARSPDDGDTESDFEQETPRNNKLKKRLSEIHRPGDDDGTIEGRVPLRSVNINDDAAEKRRRRKSTKLHIIENALAGPSNEGGGPSQDIQTGEHSKAAGKQKQQLNAVTAPVLNVQLDINNAKFEEWMKMATDNKINAQNSWNFALIDYFHDMSLLRNDDDNSINFQRASCTLDGCVKIWTSRVDSVGTETGKLLSNLETGGKGVEDEGENSDNPDAEPSQTKKRKERGPGTTLVKDPAQLKNKKPDLEFAVDPLFRKTCADFDEGGASGLLMNHLSLGLGSEGCMRVIFDASDPMGKVDEEEVVEEPEDLISLSYLRKEFLPDMTTIDDKEIAPSLVGFSFSQDGFSFDDSMFLPNNSHRNLDLDDDDDDDFGGEGNIGDGDLPPVEDFFTGADAVNDDFGADHFGGDDDNQSNAGSAIGEAHAGGQDGRPGPFVPFDPRRMPNDRDLVLAMADGDGGTLDYFDQNVLKNWAGPEHWKLRKVIRRPEADAGGANKPNKRQKKEAVKIDFMTPSEKDLKEITKELFAGVKKGTSINLPGTGATTGKKGSKKKKEKRSNHRLPDDIHFSSQQLVTLFLKPKFSLKMRGRLVRLNENDGEVDEAFWAQAAADQAAANREHDADNDGDDPSNPAPFATQFFHEDDFGGGFDDDGGFDGEGRSMMPDDDAGEQDLLAATQGQTRRVRPEFVNYARRAKRVDVRKLKDNIWRGLGIVVSKDKNEGEEESMDVDEQADVEPTNPSEARQFSQVITGLQKSYPRDKMEEISTSFCFICLLHLANEQGLKLESNLVEDLELEDPESQMNIEGEKKVGDLWDVKIYRDPNATKSA